MNDDELNLIKLSASISRIEERLTLFNDMSREEFSRINQRLDKFENSLDQRIDDRIALYNQKKVYSTYKWFVGTLLGSVAITVVTSIVMNFIHH